jgi:hypothetical protein
MAFSCVFCVSLSAVGHDIRPDMHIFSKTLRLLPGQSMACEVALRHKKFRGKFTYFLISNLLEGSATAHINNPSAANPPVDVNLYMDGDNDRYGFTHYYAPAMPLKIHHHLVGLRGIILNICMNTPKKAQVGLMIDLPSGEDCLMTTRTWNYCR